MCAVGCQVLPSDPLDVGRRDGADSHRQPWQVFQRQPERVRNFLLQTSILERLSDPLCDAVTTQNDSMVLLDTL